MRSDGFTLLEILFATTILAIGMLALATMQFTAIRANAFGKEMTGAICLAQTQLERMKSVGDVTTLSSGGEAGPIDAEENPGGIFNRFWTVAAGPTSDSRRVTVTIAWSTGLGDHNITLKTMTRGKGI
jgi:prepilin-type N-terminal cleavage/methylation domain-containing protein